MYNRLLAEFRKPVSNLTFRLLVVTPAASYNLLVADQPASAVWKNIRYVSVVLRTMPEQKLSTVPPRPESGRGEVVVAVADLAANIEKLAVNVNRIVALLNPGKVESRGKSPDRAPEAREGGDLAEATNFPLSPRQDSWTGNVYPFEVDASIEASRVSAKDNSSRAKNGIAGRVLDLHDRLGGFIKNSPLPPPDQKRR
jgi:hypothetical protein